MKSIIKQTRKSSNLRKKIEEQTATSNMKDQSSRRQINLLTGKKIKTNHDIASEIKLKRVDSYEKVSFSIRKMQYIFKPDAIPQRQKEKLMQDNPQMHDELENFKAKIIFNHLKSNQKQQKMLTESQIEADLLLTQRNLRQKQHSQNLRMKTQETKSLRNFTKTSSKIRINEMEAPQNLTPVLNKSKYAQVIKIVHQQNGQILLNEQNMPGVKFKNTKQHINVHKPSIQSSYTKPRTSMHSQTKNMMRSSKDLSSGTHYLHMDELLTDAEKKSELVEEVCQFRKSLNLWNKPQQWHFHNVLNLSKIGLHRTNLKISCQSWILIDHLQLKYLRGWNPKKIEDFTPLLRLFICEILFNLLQTSSIPMRKIVIRIRNEAVEGKMRQKDAKAPHLYSLTTDSIINCEDLLIGVLLTHRIDLMWHLILAMGFMIKNQWLLDMKSDHPEKSQYIVRDKDGKYEHISILIKETQEELEGYEKAFLLKCRQAIELFGMIHTSVQIRGKKHKTVVDKHLLHQKIFLNHKFKPINQIQEIQLHSTCLDMSLLFMHCLKRQFFCNLFMYPSKSKTYTFRLKYNMGYRYWQTRSHTWHHQHNLGGDYQGLHGRCHSTGNQCCVGVNTKKKIIIAMADSRVNMHLSDINGVDAWADKIVKRCDQRNQNRKKQYVRESVIDIEI